LSIQRLLSLRAARRRREQHFTSRRPGRTTAGWLACALALPALLALALAWSLRPLVHDDLFWHLRTGEWIAAHHRVPLADLFSYTRYGARWITHEWGFSLASFLVFRAAGAAGLVVLTPVLAVAVFAAVAWRAVELAAAEPGASAGPALTPARCLLLAALLALGLWAVSPEVFLRAALAGELMLALALAALTRYRRTGRRRWLVGLVALFWLWANLHSGVLFGLGVLALYALEAASGGNPLRPLLGARRYRRTARHRLGGVFASIEDSRLASDRSPPTPPRPADLRAPLRQMGSPENGTPVRPQSSDTAEASSPSPAEDLSQREDHLPERGWEGRGTECPRTATLSARQSRSSKPTALPSRSGAARRSTPSHAPAGVAPGGSAPYLWTLAGAVVAALLNPNGSDAPLYPFILGRILFASGIPWELGHFSASAPDAGGSGAALWLLVVLLLLGLLPLRQARRLSLPEAASIAAFLLLTLLSHRFVFDLVVVGLPTLFKLLALPPPLASPAAAEPAAADSAGTSRPNANRISGLAGRPALAAALVALYLLPVGPAAVAAAAAGWRRRPPAAGGLIAEPFPEAAVRFVAAQGIAGPGDRVFNHQNYGGFLGWRLRVPVFWDGRNDVFAELVREVAAAPFGVTARRHGVDWLLIAEHDYPGILPEIAAGRWGLVYWDDFCAVYLRRGPRYAALLQRFELRLFPPFGGRPGLAALAADPRGAAAARAELAQVLAANPAAQRALYFEGMISLYRGDLRRGEAELLAASRIRPSDQVDRVLELLHHPPRRRAR
jgi:hypothetical protein